MPLDFRLSKPSSLLLDLVRGTAAQAVVVGHALSFFGVAQIPYLQNSAVAVFFLVSGIVIPYSTVRKVEEDPHSSFSSYREALPGPWTPPETSDGDLRPWNRLSDE